jgi:hypothetical protein
MRVACPAILFIPLCHIERSETSLDVLRSRSCKEINLRFFASLRMTERLPASPTAAEDSAEQTASDLPAD